MNGTERKIMLPCIECIEEGAPGRPAMLEKKALQEIKAVWRQEVVAARDKHIMRPTAPMVKCNSALTLPLRPLASPDASATLLLLPLHLRDAACWTGSRGHEIAVDQILSSAAVHESVVCPACFHRGAAHPGYFNRQTLLAFFDEDNTQRIGQVCRCCAYDYMYLIFTCT